jgi:hypothetical protein
MSKASPYLRLLEHAFSIKKVDCMLVYLLSLIHVYIAGLQVWDGRDLLHALQ